MVGRDPNLCHINASPVLLISELRNLIKEEKKNGVLNGIDASALKLWKVRMTLVVICSYITGDTTLAFGGYPYRAR
jgi:hypothetical protein